MALQIQGKFIADTAIDGEKLLLASGQAVRLMSASGEVRLIELDEVTGKVKVNGIVVALQPDLVAEINRAVAAEVALQANIETEAAARVAADSALATAVQAVVEAEAAARVAADAATLSSAQSYTDTKIADVVGSAPGLLEALGQLSNALSDNDAATGLLDALAAEKAAREAADSQLAGDISDLEDLIVQEVQAAISAEETRALGAEEFLQNQIDALSGGSGSGSVSLSSLDARLQVIEGPVTTEGSVAKAEQDAKNYADAAVFVEKTRAEGIEGQLAADINAEETRALGAEALLSGRLDTIEGSGEGSVAKAEADAKAYADQKIADLVNSAPAVLDTLQELAAALNNDASFASTVAGQIGAVAADVAAEEIRALAAEVELANDISDVATDLAQEILDRQSAVTQVATSVQGLVQTEAQARTSAINSLTARVEVLEDRAFHKVKFVLSAQDITNGYVDLGHEALANSVVAAVGRLMIHEGVGEDFTMSVVSGVSRMTFVGNLVSPSEEQLAAGDVIFVRYMA